MGGGGGGGGGGGEGWGEGARGEGGVEDAGVRRTRLSGVDEPDKTKVREGGEREVRGELHGMVPLLQEKMEEVKQKLVEAGVPREHLPGKDEHDHYEVGEETRLMFHL